jgi:hypothetical protein
MTLDAVNELRSEGLMEWMGLGKTGERMGYCSVKVMRRFARYLMRYYISSSQSVL